MDTGDMADMGFNFTSWTDLRKFDQVKEDGTVDADADADWYAEEEKAMSQKHGGDFIKVSWGKDQVDYFCKLCNVHSNSRLTVNTHCDGMKHLRKKKLWEDEQNNANGESSTNVQEPSKPDPAEERPEKPPSKRKELNNKDYRDQWTRPNKDDFNNRNRGGFGRGRGRDWDSDWNFGPYGRGEDRDDHYRGDRGGPMRGGRDAMHGGREGPYENRRFLDRMEPGDNSRYNRSRSPPRMYRNSRSPVRPLMPLPSDRNPSMADRNPSMEGRMYSDRIPSSSAGAKEILPGRFRDNFDDNSSDISQMRVPSPPKVEFKANRLSSLERLANLSVFSEEDAKIALNVVSSLMNSLKVYYQAKSNLKVLDMLIQAQLKVGLIAAQVEPTPTSASTSSLGSDSDFMAAFRQEKQPVKSIPRF